MNDYKAITTKLVGVEPGKVTKIHPNKNVSVITESPFMIEKIDPTNDCVVATFESGPEGTMTEHAFNMNEA
jgi:hypothetical protein